MPNQPHAVTHILDSYPEYFEATINKMKTHEIRLDSLGPFVVGDSILLKEMDPATEVYTGRTAELIITFISPGPESWLVPGFTTMSTRLKDPTQYYLANNK